MKKILRSAAIEIHGVLGTIALGHLDEETLDIALTNYNACGKVKEDIDKLNEELNKRLYSDIDDARKEAFFQQIAKTDELRMKLNGAKTVEAAQNIVSEMQEILKKAKEDYADVDALYEKHKAVYEKIVSKEVEIELVEVDADAFIKGILKGTKNISVHELKAQFAPMFKEEEKQESDFSELDELLK